MRYAFQNKNNDCLSVIYNTIKSKWKVRALHERPIKQIYTAHKNASCWEVSEQRSISRGGMQIGSNEENWS